MRYDLIIKDIIQTTKEDYAGFHEREELHDTQTYVRACGQAWKDHTLNSRYFHQLIQQYLVILQDRNLRFHLNDNEEYQAFSRGFRTRRYGDYLYVTEVTSEEKLSCGDMIKTINMSSPAEQKRKIKANLYGSDKTERELWGGLLKMARHGMIEHTDGSSEDFVFQNHPVESSLPVLSCSQPSSDTCVIQVSNLNDSTEVEEFLTANKKVITSCKKLIIDVRKSALGAESAYYPLFELICPSPVMLSALLDHDGIYTNYTKRNCDLMIGQLNRLMQDADTMTVNLLQTMIKHYTEQSGKGWVYEEDNSLDEIDYQIQGCGYDRQVILLTDTYCEDAAESFVLACRNLDNVTIVGRPTMGNLDYSNFVNVRYEGGFTFTYPISKSKACYEGKGFTRTGIPVDFYIPWTPAECKEDLVLQKALEL